MVQGGEGVLGGPGGSMGLYMKKGAHYTENKAMKSSRFLQFMCSYGCLPTFPSSLHVVNQLFEKVL